MLQPVTPGPRGKSAQIQIQIQTAPRSGQKSAKRPVMKVRMWTCWLSLLLKSPVLKMPGVPGAAGAPAVILVAVTSPGTEWRPLIGPDHRDTEL